MIYALICVCKMSRRKTSSCLIDNLMDFEPRTHDVWYFNSKWLSLTEYIDVLCRRDACSQSEWLLRTLRKRCIVTGYRSVVNVATLYSLCSSRQVLPISLRNAWLHTFADPVQDALEDRIEFTMKPS